MKKGVIYFVICLSNCLFGVGGSQSDLFETLFADKKVRFIQIGAHIGNTPNDPIFHLVHKYGWTGVLIEPLPKLFSQLRDNYQGVEGLYFENIAISETSGEAEIYYIPYRITKRFPAYATQLGSFLEDHSRKHFAGVRTNVLLVQTEPLQYIVDKYMMDELDLLCIDTEGHDMVILNSIDFNTIRPSVMLFEHRHADGTDRTGDAYHSCIERLESFGYSVVWKDQMDTIVVHESFER